MFILFRYRSLQSNTYIPIQYTKNVILLLYVFVILLFNLCVFVYSWHCRDTKRIYWTCSYVLVSNTTFNNISVISLRSVLFVDETVLSGEKHRSVASHWQPLSHNVVSRTPRLNGIRTHKFDVVVVGTDCIGSYKSNYHTITITTVRAVILKT